LVAVSAATHEIWRLESSKRVHAESACSDRSSTENAGGGGTGRLASDRRIAM
jgi:hypothetical protein